MNLATVLADEPIHGVYSSPLTRAIQTARPLASQKNLEIRVQQGLMELNFGRLQGLQRDALEAPERGWIEQWKQSDTMSGRAEGGESRQELLERVRRELDTILASADGPTILVVGHRHTNAALLCLLARWPTQRALDLRIRQRFLYEIALAPVPTVRTIYLEGKKLGRRYLGFRS